MFEVVVLLVLLTAVYCSPLMIFMWEERKRRQRLDFLVVNEAEWIVLDEYYRLLEEVEEIDLDNRSPDW